MKQSRRFAWIDFSTISCRAVSGKGRKPRQDFTKDGSQTEDVGLLGGKIEFASCLLRRHVTERPQHDSWLGLRRFFGMRAAGWGDGLDRFRTHLGWILEQIIRQDFRHAPIHDVNHAKIADHDVRGFQIAMHDPMRMGERDGLADRFEDLQKFGQILRGAWTLLQQFVQRSAFDEPHDQEGAGIGQGPLVVDGNDARMVQVSHDQGFAIEAAGAGPGRRCILASKSCRRFFDAACNPRRRRRFPFPLPPVFARFDIVRRFDFHPFEETEIFVVVGGREVPLGHRFGQMVRRIRRFWIHVPTCSKIDEIRRTFRNGEIGSILPSSLNIHKYF